jgi:AcrR family transcriptional regulator
MTALRAPLTDEAARHDEPGPARRRYDSALRRQQAADTRDRIVAAGSELLRASSVRDWRALTVRAVAERAGVHERTVYRHFGNEQGLRDAVMHRLEGEAGIDLGAMELADVAGVAARIFEHVSSYPLDAPADGPLDPTLLAAKRRQHEALLAAVDGAAAGWSEVDRRKVAALLDVLWSVAAYERLVTDWQLERRDAIGAITWAIGLVEGAVRAGGGVPR